MFKLDIIYKIFFVLVLVLSFNGCSVINSTSSLAGSSTSLANTVAWKYDNSETMKLSSK